MLGSDGYYTASVSVSDTEASGSKTTIIGLTSGMTLSYTGDGVSSVDVRSVMMESGLTPTAYQAVTNAFDMTESGVPSYGFIRPDIVDDVLTATMPAAQTGDVAVFGRTASKIESGISYLSGASFSIGTTTVTGMSAGVLSSVGDVVGVLAIGRALTTAEKATLLAYYQARGAGAWI